MKNLDTKLCVGNCPPGSYYNINSSSCDSSCVTPYFADFVNAVCTTKCPSQPMTFARLLPNRKCETTCNGSEPWHDLINRECVSSCPVGTYIYNLNVSCVSFCPEPYYLQSLSICVLTCSNIS